MSVALGGVLLKEVVMVVAGWVPISVQLASGRPSEDLVDNAAPEILGPIGSAKVFGDRARSNANRMINRPDKRWQIVRRVLVRK